MHVPAAAAAAGGVTAGGGAWLFSYNKENFGYDEGQRFGRFMSARGFANTQVGQYREDTEGLTEMTVAKMDTWSMVCCGFLAICTALSCAGRIGMHGAAPPGWFCALYSGNIFAAVLFIGMSLWLSMHGSLRAQCAAASLLTRKVRLPIPSMGHIDQARVFGSSYEKQEWRDIFRVPFMRHPEYAPDMPDADPDDADDDKSDGKKKKKMKHYFQYQAKDPHKTFATTGRSTVPSWIRDEQVVDKAGPMGATKETSSELEEPDIFEFEGESQAPTHFNMIAKAQEEWRDYDVYARICMLYGVCSFLYAVCYYGIGTAICELRGFWVMWSMPIVFMGAQFLCLRLDIVKGGSHNNLPNLEILGHLAPFFAVLGCTLEYRAYWSWASYVTTWGFAIMAHLAHLIMAARFLDLAWPSFNPSGEMPDEAGKQWWPNTWKVPQAFSKALWFIAPPKKLEPGQHDLMHEMGQLRSLHGGVTNCRRRRGKTDVQAAAKAMGKEEGQTSGAYSGPSPFQDFGTKRAHDLPWQLIRVAIVSVIFMWFYMLVADAAEIILGPESLMRPPGEPPWIRDTKYRSWGPEKIHLSSASSLPSDYRLFEASVAYYDDDDAGHGDSHGEESHDGDDHGADHRRLHAMKMNGLQAAMDELAKAMPEIGWLADQVEQGQTDTAKTLSAPMMESTVPSQSFMSQPLPVHSVEWPPMFAPKHLVCSSPRAGAIAKVAALTPRGFGALVDLDSQAEATPFALEGLGEHGPLAGAAWGHGGLQLVTKAGKLFRCPGHAIGELGAWKCQASAAAPLPMAAGMRLTAAAVKEHESEHMVAVIFEHLPKMVALFRSSGAEWSPAGEVHVPVATTQISLAFHENKLVMTTVTGEVHIKNLDDGSALMHAAENNAASREFHSACHLPNGKLMRLALRQKMAGLGAAWGPELIGSP